MISEVISDPGFVLATRWILGAVFLTAVVHKLKAPAAFAGTLRAYRLLPEAFTSFAAFVVIGVESFTVILLIVNRPLGSVLAFTLMMAYAFAMGVNILRGRRDIDCGCVGPALRQTLSGWLVLRNFGFAVLAALTFLSEPTVRELTIVDFVTAILAAITFSLIYSTANRLSTIAARYRRQHA